MAAAEAAGAANPGALRRRACVRAHERRKGRGPARLRAHRPAPGRSQKPGVWILVRDSEPVPEPI